MGNYRDRILKVLKEGHIPYGDQKERMHPDLEEALREGKHSLGAHPIFPEGDESDFGQKMAAKGFSDALNSYKRQFDTDSVDQTHILDSMVTLQETMSIEKPHIKELEELAERLIREEYNIDDGDVEVIAEITGEISLECPIKNYTPLMVEDMEFDDHDAIVRANEEVYKRRFVNAMKEGAAKRANHIYKEVDDELVSMDPRLPRKYGKLMALSELASYMIDENEMNGGEMQNGGMVNVEWPKSEDEKPVIHAQGMTFPLLMHELVKGVMELLSSHGLPQDEKMRNYVTGKADFLGAQPWDRRLGPPIWERFTNMLEKEDLPIKHHIYSEMCGMEVHEFNTRMKEIMAGTKKGKKYITELAEEIKNEMALDEYEEAMRNMESEGDFMGIEDLNRINPEEL